MLNGKTIIVTGAASGIGAATVVAIRSLGGKVIGLDRNPPTDEIDDFLQVDLMDKQAVEQAAADLSRRGADGLANIAGLPPTRPAEAVMTVNFVALRHLTLKLLDGLADGASIVNLASLAGLGWEGQVQAIHAAETLDFPDVPAFCAAHGIVGATSYFFSKQALIGWTLRNRWTWRARGIRMNAISPGPVDTPILGDFLETLGARAEEDMRVMDRPGTAEDIAPVVAFLLSDGSGWIRGANIPVDGGMRAHVDATAAAL